jgi:uncharacterized protein HemY
MEGFIMNTIIAFLISGVLWYFFGWVILGIMGYDVKIQKHKKEQKRK